MMDRRPDGRTAGRFEGPRGREGERESGCGVARGRTDRLGVGQTCAKQGARPSRDRSCSSARAEAGTGKLLLRPGRSRDQEQQPGDRSSATQSARISAAPRVAHRRHAARNEARDETRDRDRNTGDPATAGPGNRNRADKEPGEARDRDRNTGDPATVIEKPGRRPGRRNSFPVPKSRRQGAGRSPGRDPGRREATPARATRQRPRTGRAGGVEVAPIGPRSVAAPPAWPRRRARCRGSRGRQGHAVVEVTRSLRSRGRQGHAVVNVTWSSRSRGR